MRCVRVVFHGRVQGVSFRAFVKQHAARLGLDGWVRNRSDGTVEAVIAGEAAKAEELLALGRQGPSAARVEDVRVSEEKDLPEKGFRQLPTI